jgi:SAM-dependent methyltransferase
MEFTLHWQQGDAKFEDRFLGRRVNAWRDVFPPALMEKLHGCSPGEAASASYCPGELVDPHTLDKVIHLPVTRFRKRSLGGRNVSPKVGRFYPLGMLSGLPGIYSSTITPFRILEIDGETMTVDLNHPLAGRPLAVEAVITRLQEKQGDTGGSLMHWPEEICYGGPGMQAPLPERPTEFFDEQFFSRSDADDATFYAKPRMIGHIDEQASANLRSMYRRFLKNGMRVLDLMSSMQSHLPDDLDIDVTGLGLNAEEMAANPLLTEYVVHDLNRDPSIPLKGHYDAVACSLSIEYLTDPVSVLSCVREQLAPGGVLLVGMSNRWFPTKAVRGWVDLNEFERVGLVHEMMRRAGFDGKRGAISMRNDWRPQGDRHFLETRGVSDPVYMTWVEKS